MIFNFLSKIREIKTLYALCCEAERFAAVCPAASVLSARRAAEYAIKLYYGAKLSKNPAGVPLLEILSDWDFMHSIPNRNIVDAIHFVRHQQTGQIDFQTAMDVLEKLHFLIGEFCVLLGLIRSYPPFNGDSPVIHEWKTEPEVEAEIIEALACGRRRDMKPASQAHTDSTVRDVHTDPRLDRIDKERGSIAAGTDSGANAKMAYQVLARYISDHLPETKVMMETQRSEIVISTGSRHITVSVRTGCTNLGSKDHNGEWQLLPGIDYVIYAPDVRGDTELPAQFRVLTKDEFINMWRSLKLVRFKVSNYALKRLREQHGDKTPFPAEEYGDVQSVQSFSNSGRKTGLLLAALIEYPLLSDSGLDKILN